jgi:hypothetical protein
MVASPVAAAASVRPDLVSVRALTDLLDKAFKTARIYKITNTAAKTFTEKVYNDLAAHIRRYGRLTYVVQGYRLFHNGDLVYENTSPIENLAFTLFVDGIRALSFVPGLSQEDFTYFLEALGKNSTFETSDTTDEDIVTRVWQRNLSTIWLVTAEEIVKSLDSASVVIPQDAHTLHSKVSQLAEIRAAEVARQTQVEEGKTARPSQSASYGFGLYAVSPEEQQALAQEIQDESRRDDVTFLLSILSTILASS